MWHWGKIINKQEQKRKVLGLVYEADGKAYNLHYYDTDFCNRIDHGNFQDTGYDVPDR